MAGLFGVRASALLFSLAMAGMAQGQANQRPAELPPAGYAGLQYVDSKGCAFLRAGTRSKPMWVPRVTSDGKQVCGYPPSGRRVAAAGEPGADNRVFEPAGETATAKPAPTKTTTAAKPAAPKPKATATAKPAAPPKKPVAPAKPAAPQASKPANVVTSPAPAATPGYVVAVGSFGVDSNAKKAAAVVEALGFPVIYGQLKTRKQVLVSVYAGPFTSAVDAEHALGKLHGMGFRDAVVMRRR